MINSRPKTVNIHLRREQLTRIPAILILFPLLLRSHEREGRFMLITFGKVEAIELERAGWIEFESIHANSFVAERLVQRMNHIQRAQGLRQPSNHCILRQHLPRIYLPVNLIPQKPVFTILCDFITPLKSHIIIRHSFNIIMHQSHLIPILLDFILHILHVKMSIEHFWYRIKCLFFFINNEDKFVLLTLEIAFFFLIFGLILKLRFS